LLSEHPKPLDGLFLQATVSQSACALSD
jgi:hypothetical protein